MTSRSPPANAEAGPSRQHTRFEPTKFSHIWSSFVTHLRPPTHPSTTSSSAADESTFNMTATDYFDDRDQRDGVSGPTLDLLNPMNGTTSKHNKRLIQRRMLNRQQKSSVANSASRYGDDEYENHNFGKNHEAVSHTVVDNDFEHFTPKAPKSDTSTNGGTGTNTAAGTNIGVGSKKKGGRKEKKQHDSDDDDEDEDAEEEEDEDSGENSSNEKKTGSRSGSKSGNAAHHGARFLRWWRGTSTYEVLVERTWPIALHFLDSSFPEKSKERSFQKESWFMNKQGAVACSFYFIISWVLTVALQSLPLSNFAWIAYFGVGGLFTLPILPMVIFDYPRLHPVIYQPCLVGATWVFADILLIEMNTCGFFAANNTCGNRTFLNMLGFAFGTPVLSLMAMKLHRAWAMAGAIQWIVLVGILLMTQDNYPLLFYRNIIMFAFFHAFIIFTAFLKERSDRQMFALRQQLKIQYRATQSAQVMERRSADSKKRFVSYIFHEVRVPLNTALLAVQNLDGEDVFKGLQEDQEEMVHGLLGSLSMMEKVLNDVLSFNRMESGKFAQARKPFEFHKSIQLVALSHRMQAQTAGVDLLVELDGAIDRLGGMFVGDEMRLRQVTSNLVSNALKFTQKGSVRIVTKLLYPRMEPTPSSEIDDPLKLAHENAQNQGQQDSGGVIIVPQLSMVGGDRHDSTCSAEFDSKPTASIKEIVDEKSVPLEGYNTAGGDLEKGSVVMERKRLDFEDNLEKEKEREERNRLKAVVRVEIHDTGVGMKKQDVVDNRLFSPYVQTEIGRRQGGKGSGLGLALVRQIVKLSGGRLGVESQLGKGSIFWFELPYSLPSKRRSSEAPTGFGAGDSFAGGGESSGLRSAVSTPGIQVHRPAFDRHDAASPTPSRSPRLNRPTMENRGDTSTSLPTLPNFGRTGEIPRDAILDEIVISTYPPPLSTSDYSPTGLPFGMSSLPQTQTEDGVTKKDFADPFIQSQVAAGPSSSSAQAPAAVSSQQIDPTDRDRRISEVDSDKTKIESSPAAAGQSRTMPRRSGSIDNGPLCALVVDDDKLTRMLMSRMLTRLGHQVTTAENGKIALGMINDSFQDVGTVPKFDVVFLDNQMPMMSGVEVAQHVRGSGNGIFIVGCTGNALREDQDEYLSAGADDILPKPIHQKAVINMLAEARRRVNGETDYTPFDDRRGSHNS